jgi:putative ubiquitin-RnfH superfamily antitoxin RatB of RatAB toxin-antitoxin module
VRVEVVYATSAEQAVLEVQLPAGATVGDAVHTSGILARFPEIDLAHAAIGIFGERATLDEPIEEGDRVEIYRPLFADPKEARRRRARTRV